MNRRKIEFVCEVVVNWNTLKIRNDMHDTIYRSGQVNLTMEMYWNRKHYNDISGMIRNEALNLTGYFK